MKSFVLSILCVVLSISWMNGQVEETPKLKSNALYGTGGFLGLGVAGNINYERQIGTTNTWLFRNMAVKVGYGGLNVWDTQETTYMTTLNFLSGKKANHLELNGGFVVYDTPIDYNFNLAGNIGYRYQKPDGYFIFRAGLGVPDGIYISLGAAF